MNTELIVNEAAGGGKAKRLIPQIIDFFNQNKHAYHISWTTLSESATEIAKKATENGIHRIISIGGDGTINEIINGILFPSHPGQFQPTLGIIPSGWANDFIKSTSIPVDTQQACEIIQNGYTKLVDVGIINNQIYFANVFGIGFDAEIAALANEIKTRHPHWKALSAYVYVFATMKKLLSPLPSFFARIEIDHQTIEGEMLFLAIANGRVEGGKFNIAPQAKIDDGLLDICIVSKMGRVRCFHLLPRVIKGTHQNIREVFFCQGSSIRVEAERPVAAQVAGEILPPQSHYHIQILPKRLRLIAP